ncbi:invasion associated locus B family protein [Agrobacterium sp. OT33]|uniref:invasion associated locus B family protein n=1 Tax=Agrobacterium sp. OT33 TaxID=2815338 RepID=UPI001A8D1C50|nr:invasion associated locus B family protein [Agrobacterium sp. OT33]MBO0128365.1 invasion associated locus B family protein [Agrobacterium sp. OT33]
MTRDTISTSLFASTAALPIQSASQAPVNQHTRDEQFQEWQLRRVEKSGHQLSMLRFERSQPHYLFAKLVIELNWTADDQMLGVLAMPPGLKASEGVRIQLDDGHFSTKLPFLKTGPSGGIVRLDIKSEALEHLRNAHRLNILAHPAAGKRKLLFSVPLDGFVEASDRLKQINNDRII